MPKRDRASENYFEGLSTYMKSLHSGGMKSAGDIVYRRLGEYRSIEGGGMKITLTEAEVLKTGTNALGHWTLYGYKGHDEEGNFLDRLKSFEKLPMDKPIHVLVEKEDNERFGASYKLKLAPADSQPDQQDRPKQVKEEPTHDQRISDLERRVSKLEGADADIPF